MMLAEKVPGMSESEFLAMAYNYHTLLSTLENLLLLF